MDCHGHVCGCVGRGLGVHAGRLIGEDMRVVVVTYMVLPSSVVQYNLSVVLPTNLSHMLTGVPSWNNAGCQIGARQQLIETINPDPAPGREHAWHASTKQVGAITNKLYQTPVLSAVVLCPLPTLTMNGTHCWPQPIAWYNPS